jgi:hypothetical protein
MGYKGNSQTQLFATWVEVVGVWRSGAFSIYRPLSWGSACVLGFILVFGLESDFVPVLKCLFLSRKVPISPENLDDAASQVMLRFWLVMDAP